LSIAFALLLLAAAGETIARADGRFAVTLHAHVDPAAATGFQLVTQLGSTAVLVAVAAVAAGYLARLGRRQDAALVILAFAGAEVLTWSLKAVFQRERPRFEDPVATASSFSFPSGHALVSAAVYGTVAYLLWQSLRPPRARAACVAGAALLVAAIGFSRLYLGVHYLSDVLAGYCIALAWLLLITTLREKRPLASVSWTGARTRVRRSSTVALAAILLLAMPAGCGSDDDSSAPELPRGSEPVELEASDFVDRIDNPYWPMAPGSKWIYRETDGEGSEQRVEVTVTDRSKEVLGIDATVVHDVVSEDGELVEDTYDWYAQDESGNVWYLGEDTKEYEGGKIATTAGSWEAGVDGAQAGVVMPGAPEVGQAYRQEHYAGEAEDRGEILSLDEQANVPFGSFDGVLKTKDTTPLEPKVLEHKYYAKGIGPVLAVGVSGGSREELVSFESPS
jgi:membrane-associated phospholipid phosphatase